LLAVTAFAGLALIAGAIVHNTFETRDADPYQDAEEIVSTFLNAVGEPVQSVRRVSGPFVFVKLKAGDCYLVDVSTQYQSEAGDTFWLAGASDSTSVDC